MQKWKYCAIKKELDDTKVLKLKMFDAAGKHKGSKIPDVHQEIAKLGDDGWELITLTEITQPHAIVYYFKKLA